MVSAKQIFDRFQDCNLSTSKLGLEDWLNLTKFLLRGQIVSIDNRPEKPQFVGTFSINTRLKDYFDPAHVRTE